MKTLLVPVDFTATSENAVNVAAEWSKRYGYARIILLKSFYDSVFETVVVAAEYSNFNQDCINTERQRAETQLQQVCRRLAATLPQVKILTAVSEAPLLRAILEVVRTEKPELIIAGSDNYTHSSDSIVAAHVISIAKASPVRVLMVPATYRYKPVTDALVPCDLNTLEIVDKVNSLRAAPQWQDVYLHVLNVDAKERYLNRDTAFQEREPPAWVFEKL
jgi:nucleotide-binding universal stress UspA family protein